MLLILLVLLFGFGPACLGYAACGFLLTFLRVLGTLLSVLLALLYMTMVLQHAICFPVCLSFVTAALCV